MTLLAFRADTGQEIESFSVPADEWDRMRSQALGTYVDRVTHKPLVVKRSILGLQFFAHRPGEGDPDPQPMSALHQMTQVELVRALRAAGFCASVERRGRAQTGEQWQADVYCDTGSHGIAFEVQLAPQTLEEYELRTARYARSGADCVWLVLSPTRYRALARRSSTAGAKVILRTRSLEAEPFSRT